VGGQCLESPLTGWYSLAVYKVCTRRMGIEQHHFRKERNTRRSTSFFLFLCFLSLVLLLLCFFGVVGMFDGRGSATHLRCRAPMQQQRKKKGIFPRTKTSEASLTYIHLAPLSWCFGGGGGRNENEGEREVRMCIVWGRRCHCLCSSSQRCGGATLQFRPKLLEHRMPGGGPLMGVV